MQKFSFNIHAYNVDRKVSDEWVLKNRPETFLVLNDANYASHLADMGVKYPILRLTNNDDNIHLKINSFSEWWNIVKGNYVDKRLIVHFANEPHTALDRLNRMCEEGMSILHAEGHRGVFCNHSVGTPEVNELKGALAGMMLKLQDYPDEMFWGIHEYMMGEYEWNVPYEIGRYREALKSYPKISILLTEFGFDFVGDVYKNHPEIGNKRGHRDYPEEKVLKDFKTAFDQFYNVDKQIKGVNAFCLGNSGGWDSYNFEGFPLEKFKVLEVNNTFEPYETLIRSSVSATNRRKYPTADSEKSPTPLTVDVKVLKLNEANGWALYQYTDGNWWSRRDLVVETEVPNVESIKINLYNAPPEIIEEAEELVQRLMDIFSKYKAEVG